MIVWTAGQRLPASRENMARILALDDDALARAVLIDALRGQGHEVVGCSEPEEVLARLEVEEFTIVVSDVVMPVMDGIELARRISLLPRPVPVVLVSMYGRGDVVAKARAQGIPVVGFLPKPLDPDRLGRILDSLTLPPSVPEHADDWSGAEFLHRVDGPMERFPPARVLFLAHRIDATGAISMEQGNLRPIVAVRGGRIVYISGIPGLLRALDPTLPETGQLGSAIATAVVAGHAPDRALQVAGEALGDYFARLVGVRGGKVSFDPTFVAPTGSFPLPDPAPRLIAGGLRKIRTPAYVARTWDAMEMATVRVRIPDDSPEGRWGLDSTAMRVMREAPCAGVIGELVVGIAGDDATHRLDVQRAIDLLHLLGLLVVDGGPLQAPRGRTKTPARHEATQEDPRVLQLRDALVRMEGSHSVEVLELGTRLEISEEEVSAAYREVSRRYHPDTFFNAPPVVRGLAESCFAQVNSAYESLRLPGALLEAQRLLQARAKGEKYVSERDHVTARIAFRRGEVSWRNRDWRGADRQFVEAYRIDPQGWPHALYDAHGGWLSKRLSSAEALERLAAIQPPEPQRAAEVLMVIGNVLKVEGRLDEAHERFSEALQKDPENRDAIREVRLHDRRNPPKPTAPAPTSGGIFGNLLNRKKD